MDLGISGKNALICGASAGMGRAIAAALAAEGANIFMCARTEKTLAEAAGAIKKTAQGKVEHLACDLSDEKSRHELADAIKQRLGDVEILIHNTGGPTPTLAEETSVEDFQKGFDSLFKSVVHLNQQFVPAMKKNKWGRIINVTSLSVMEPIGNLAVSNSIRSAVTAYLKTLSDELAPHNVTVNCVAPGSISTGRVEELIEARAKKAGISQEQYQADYIKAIPAGRMGTAEEFGSVVAFLVSQQASYVTGSTICVDGGRRRSTY
jgi:3-oxoacyl-[acyl-carrier protein] reductase